MIGITHEQDETTNVLEKLLIMGINFIKLSALSYCKFLLIFDDKDLFDNFDISLVENIFKVVKYTDLPDIISARLARIHILGLPLHTWTLESLHKIASKWGTFISSNPTSPWTGSYINPSILIETTSPSKIAGTLVVDIDGSRHDIVVTEACDWKRDQNVSHTMQYPSFPYSESDIDSDTILGSQTIPSLNEPDLSHDDSGVHNNINTSQSTLPNTGPTQNHQHDLCSTGNTVHDNQLQVHQGKQIICKDIEQQMNTSSVSDSDKWNYRTRSTTSNSSISISTDYKAEALQIADVSQPIHKTAQLSLCRGLFGMHIRRGRGRPKKYKAHTTTQSRKKKSNIIRVGAKHKSDKPERATTKYYNHFHDTKDLQLILYDAEKDKREVALRIYSDAMDMGLHTTEAAEQTINKIAASL